MMAARLWWSLKYHGHPFPLILEGGFKKWEENGREIDAAEPCPLKVYAEFDGQQESTLRVDASAVLSALEKDTLIIDARNASQYNGKVFHNRYLEKALVKGKALKVNDEACIAIGRTDRSPNSTGYTAIGL